MFSTLSIFGSLLLVEFLVMSPLFAGSCRRESICSPQPPHSRKEPSSRIATRSRASSGRAASAGSTFGFTRTGNETRLGEYHLEGTRCLRRPGRGVRSPSSFGQGGVDQSRLRSPRFPTCWRIRSLWRPVAFYQPRRSLSEAGNRPVAHAQVPLSDENVGRIGLESHHFLQHGVPEAPSTL